MPLTELKISHFRNLGSVALAPSPYLNLIYGVNGSGKTSLLEALSVLAHGRSFRTRKYRRLVQHQTAGFTVFGSVREPQGNTVAIGVNRPYSGESQFKVDGINVRSSAELAQNLPLLVVNGDSFGLLTGSPKQRRQFFDWLVFHVKQSFRDTWAAYARCVKQRNSLLRRDKISYQDVRPWDLEIARLSKRIEDDRVSCIEPFLSSFRELVDELQVDHIGSPTIEYVNGWRSEEAYEEQLNQVFNKDRKLGYTSLGPHKSDLRIKMDGIPAGEVLSRGQQKTTIAALYIAEARVFAAARQSQCILLIDDMPAELDTDNMARVGRWLNNTLSQVFITCVDYDQVEVAWPDVAQKDHKVFHVKQGAVTEEPR